ncbi:hypothetical protein D3C73_1070630 [compost metagenome]
MAAVALVHALHLQHYRKVGGIEIRVPGGFATDPGPQLQVTLDQWWNAGRKRAVQLFHRVAVQRGNTGLAGLGQLRHDGAPDFGGGNAIVPQADAGAAQHVFVAAAPKVFRQARPQQHDHRAVAVVGMGARPAYFNQLVANGAQPGQIKL